MFTDERLSFNLVTRCVNFRSHNQLAILFIVDRVKVASSLTSGEVEDAIVCLIGTSPIFSSRSHGEHACGPSFSRLTPATARVESRTLEQWFDLATPEAELRREILRAGETDSGRRQLAQWALSRMKAAEANILQPENLAKKRFIFVGGGIHTTIAVRRPP